MATPQRSGSKPGNVSGSKPAPAPVASPTPGANTAPATPKAKSALALDTTLLPVGFRKVQIAFLDAAAAKLGISRVDFVRKAAMSAASSVLGQSEPVCEAFRVGARGSLSGLTDAQRKTVADAAKQAAAKARAETLAALRAPKAA